MNTTASPHTYGLVVIGGAHPDRRGRIAGATIPGVSNPGSMREDLGGAAFNSARAARMRGLVTALVSARGGDLAAAAVEAAIGDAGITDLSANFLDRSTPGYTAILDAEGGLVIALADMALYETGLPRHLRRSAIRATIASAGAVLVDANLPTDAIGAIMDAATGPVFGNAVSPVKAVRLAPHAAPFACVFMNRAEAQALTGEAAGDAELIAALRRAGFRSAVVTAGKEPVLAFAGGNALRLRPPHVAVVDVTGAGDALCGAAIAALTCGLSLAQAVRHGVTAACLTLQSPQAVAETLAGQAFEAQLADVPAAEIIE